jgi:hypothetical protein
VGLNVMLGGFPGVMRGMDMVAVSQVRVVRRRLVIALLVMFGGFVMVLGRMLMMLCRLRMVVRSFLRH